VEAVDALTKFRPERAWLTHLSHESTHEQAKELVEEMRAERPELANSQVEIAYDWLQIQIDVNGYTLKWIFFFHSTQLDAISILASQK
jgi:hypothetical protein